jgi:hypothetical protein
MLVTLHTLAQTYHLLPSEALARATTFDLFVLDNYSRFINYQEAKANGKAAPAPTLGVEQMKTMVEQAKNFKPKERNSENHQN